MYLVSLHYDDPRLYLHLDLSIGRRNMDNPPRHTCLPMVYFLLFKVGMTSVLSASIIFVFWHRSRVEDYYLAVHCEVDSIPKGLLGGQGRIQFYLGLITIKDHESFIQNAKESIQYWSSCVSTAGVLQLSLSIM
jgi:hypothetical protein